MFVYWPGCLSAESPLGHLQEYGERLHHNSFACSSHTMQDAANSGCQQLVLSLQGFQRA